MKKFFYIINTKNKKLGRIISFLTKFIKKNNIILINVKYIKFTGLKYKKKIYYKHSKYPGGLKKIKLKISYKNKYKEIIKNILKKMLKNNKKKHKIIKNLKIFKNKINKKITQKIKLINI